MADNATNKEKQTAKQTEKEQDTSRTASAMTATGSKPGSAKSGVSGAESARSGSKTPKSKSKGSATRAGSPKGSKAKGGKGKRASKDTDLKSETPVAEEEEEKGLPDGVIPIFLATKSQEIFECKADEDVTEENPNKLIKKEDILKDFFNRAAISDFSPIKLIIQEYPGDEILIVYDADYKHGQNFLIATTEEAKHKLLKPKKSGQGPSDSDEEAGEGEEEGEEEDVVYQYIPPEPKVWVNQGSEREIEEETVTENRKRIKLSSKRIRRAFGAPVEFQDRNVADAKDGFIECTAFEDKTFELKRIELDTGVQAIPEFTETSSQTEWKYPRNANTQYYPRVFSQKEQNQILNSTSLAKFMTSVAPRFDLAMQQNEIMNVFYDDWYCLADDDSSIGSKADHHLKEYQSFTDLQFSKEKTVTCIEWHPTIRGVVAVSVAERFSFDARIDHAAKVIMKPSLILMWSFSDPIHPQLLLEAPDDIYCFKFCPTDSNIIAGGCINGQVVLWDISSHVDRLKTQRAGKNKKALNALPGFDEDSSMDTPIVRYCCVSSIEHSHRAPITDIQWIPDHLELTRMGVPQENPSGQCVQILTCAIDHVVMVWDTRPPKTPQQQGQQDKKKIEPANPMGVPTTFKHLDLTWKPHLKIGLSKSEPGGDHSPTKICIQEVQGDRSALNTDEDDEKKELSSSVGFSSGKPGSAVKRTLTSVCTRFFVGTEDGEIVYVDWMPQKDQDSGKIQTPKPDFYHSLHDGPIVTLQRSPFFRDIVLCVGGWNFTLWKEGVSTGPILSSCASAKRLTAGYWSPTRPAVFFITKQDGTVDVWDLLDRTHEPSMTQSVSPMPITCIYPYQVTNKQHLLAVGDTSGTLHILEIPWSLRQPTANEMTGVSHYFDREVKRRGFVVSRWNFREKEKMELENEAKKKAGIAPNVMLSEEEQLQRLKLEYQQFLEEEAAFLRSLGLKDDTEEPLPDIE